MCSSDLFLLKKTLPCRHWEQASLHQLNVILYGKNIGINGPVNIAERSGAESGIFIVVQDIFIDHSLFSAKAPCRCLPLEIREFSGNPFVESSFLQIAYFTVPGLQQFLIAPCDH